jgi:integrase/recombinase XerD
MENTAIIPAESALQRINRHYEGDVKEFLKFAEDKGLTRDTVFDYVAVVKSKHQAASTFNHKIAAVKNYLRKFFDSPDLTAIQKWELDRTLSELKLKKQERGDRTIGADKNITPEELNLLIEKTPKKKAVLIEFLASTGCRISEALDIQLSHCQKKRAVHIRITGKGNKERTVRIAPDLFERIRAAYPGENYLFESKGGKKLFPQNVLKEFVRHSTRIIGRRITPHVLRHYFATQTIKRTGKITGTSRYLGHASTAITLDMYNSECLEDEDLQIV